MNKGGLFLNVNELCGDAVVLGQVHRAEYRDGVLSIRGLDLSAAMAVLGALATGDLATVRLGGVLGAPGPSIAPPGAAPHMAPPARLDPHQQGREPPVMMTHAAQHDAAARDVAEQVRAGVEQGIAQGAIPQQLALTPPPVAPAAPAPPPSAAEVFGPEKTVQRAVVEAPAAPAVPPVAPVAPPAPPAPPAAPPAAPAGALPEDVRTSKTLRPIVGYLSQTRGVRGLDAMEAAVRELRKAVPLVDEIITTENEKLRARVERTMLALRVE